MMQRLIVLSDLWGIARSQWWSYYKKSLQQHFEVEWYDCCKLGEIDLGDYDQDKLHQQFLAGGLDRAVGSLIAAEKDRLPALILAFSIGGVIAWRAVQEGLPCEYFCAVSATRLRNEQEVFSTKGKLYYGANDPYHPNEQWHQQQSKLSYELLPTYGHEAYIKVEVAKMIVRELVAFTKG